MRSRDARKGFREVRTFLPLFIILTGFISLPVPCWAASSNILTAHAGKQEIQGSLSHRAAVILDSTATLDDYISYALRNNPLIKAYDEFRNAAWQVPTQRRALPDPILSFGYFAKNVETRVGPQENSWALSQKFPFFGKLSLKGKIAEKDAEIADQTYKEKILDLVNHVKHSYYDYYRVYHDIEVLEQEKKVLRYMQDVAQVKYASGQASQQDVLKAQLALSKMDDKLIMLEREMTTVTSRLNELLNREPLSPLAVPNVSFSEVEMQNIENSYEAAEKNRPELRAADFAIDKAGKMRSLAKREYFPDLTISMQYVRVGERPLPALPENGKDALLLKAAINLPIWFQKRNAGVKEAEARAALARHRKEAIRTAIKSETQDAYTKVETARELVSLYENVILPQAEQTFLASEAGYRTGEVDFLNYLDSERALLALRRAYYRAVSDLGKQLAYLERTLGTALQDQQRRQGTLE